MRVRNLAVFAGVCAFGVSNAILAAPKAEEAESSAWQQRLVEAPDLLAVFQMALERSSEESGALSAKEIDTIRILTAHKPAAKPFEDGFHFYTALAVYAAGKIVGARVHNHYKSLGQPEAVPLATASPTASEWEKMIERTEDALPKTKKGEGAVYAQQRQAEIHTLRKKPGQLDALLIQVGAMQLAEQFAKETALYYATKWLQEYPLPSTPAKARAEMEAKLTQLDAETLQEAGLLLLAENPKQNQHCSVLSYVFAVRKNEALRERFKYVLSRLINAKTAEPFEKLLKNVQDTAPPHA